MEARENKVAEYFQPCIDRCKFTSLNHFGNFGGHIISFLRLSCIHS